MRSQDVTDKSQEQTSTNRILAGKTGDSINQSQVCFPFWMAREIALDLLEKERLEAAEKLWALELGTYKSLVAGWERTGLQKELQIKLLQEQQVLLATQLETEKAKKPRCNSFSWFMLLMGALGLGVVLGAM